MPLPGGASDKIGNRYELIWTIFQITKVLSGEFDSIHLEPVGDEGQGIEFYVQRGEQRVFHQVKRQHGATGKWSVADLTAKKVIATFWEKLKDHNASFIFVSTHAASPLDELIARVHDAKTWGNFQGHFLNSELHSSAFKDICREVGSSGEGVFDAFKRLEVKSIDESFLEETTLGSLGKLIKQVELAFNALFPLILKSVHHSLTAQDFWQEFNKNGIQPVMENSGAIGIRKIDETYESYLLALIENLEKLAGTTEFVEPSTETHSASKTEDENKTKTLPLEFAALKKETNTKSSLKASTTEPISLDEAESKFNQFVIVGDPGSGKSTALRHLCIEAARKCLLQLADFVKVPIPVFIDLSQWSEDVGPEEFVSSYWRLPGNLNQMLANGYVRLYLDGLNEMGATGGSKANQLKDWLKGGSGNGMIGAIQPKPKYVVVSCRRDAYESLSLELQIIRVQELSDERIAQFATNYLGPRANEFLRQLIQTNFSASQPSQLDDTEEAIKQLIEAMLNTKTAGESPNKQPLLPLARNPYFLTMLIEVFKAEPSSVLPKNAGKLFEKLIGVLWEREYTKKTNGWCEFDKAKKLLSRLAFSMIDSELPTTASSDYALFYVDDKIFLQAAHNANLIVLQEKTFRFNHQLIEEYFAAIGLLQVGLSHLRIVFNGAKTDQSLFRKRHRESRWEQVVIAACGIASDPSKAVREVATITPLLANKCLESGIDIGVDSVIPGLLEALGDTDRNVRRDAIRALGQTEDTTVIPYIAQAVNDLDRFIYESAITALGDMGIHGLPELIRILRTCSEEKSNLCIRTLGNLASIAVPELLKCLDDANESFVIRVIDALGTAKDNSSSELLIKQLRHPSESVRASAITALAEIGDLSALTPIARLLKEPNVKLRIHVAKQLRNFKHTDIIIFLSEALMDSDFDVHQAIFSSLTSLKKYSRANEAIKVFTRLKRKDPLTRKKNLELLYKKHGSMGLFYAIGHSYNDFHVYWLISKRMATLPNDEFAGLVKLLKNADYRQKAHLAHAIGERNESCYCQDLEHLLSHKSAFVRGNAIEAMGKVRCIDCIASIATLLKDSERVYSNSNETVGNKALVALRTIGTAEALEFLRSGEQ